MDKNTILVSGETRRISAAALKRANPLCHQVQFNNPLVKSFRASGSAFGKQTQFGFWNRKFCKATIQADHKLRNYPDVGLVNVFQPAKMDRNLARELA